MIEENETLIDINQVKEYREDAFRGVNAGTAYGGLSIEAYECKNGICFVELFDSDERTMFFSEITQKQFDRLHAAVNWQLLGVLQAGDYRIVEAALDWCKSNIRQWKRCSKQKGRTHKLINADYNRFKINLPKW